MGKIVVSDNVTVDGVVQDPTGEEGFRHGGWFARAGTSDREAFARAALDEALAAEAFLMGRRTYEWLASRWPSRTGPLADRLNSIPKYVVSSTLEPDWNNCTVIRGDPVSEVSELKRQVNGDIIVPASFQLVRKLMEHHLVDELRLLVYPFVLGAGQRLFDATTDTLSLHLVDNRRLGDDLAYLSYTVDRSGHSPT
jgi:dihydrofolate reductase